MCILILVLHNLLRNRQACVKAENIFLMSRDFESDFDISCISEQKEKRNGGNVLCSLRHNRLHFPLNAYVSIKCLRPTIVEDCSPIRLAKVNHYSHASIAQLNLLSTILSFF